MSAKGYVISLDDQIAAIEAMSGKERKAEWLGRIGTAAPPAFGSGLLARALAHHLQTKRTGVRNLNKTELKHIETLASKGEMPSSAVLQPGVRLSRTWHGDTHQVTVLERGFEYRGAHFASLTQIAQHITGTQWSGPRFFSLNSPRLAEPLGISCAE